MSIRKKVVSNSFGLSVKPKDGTSVSVLSTEVKYATSSSFVNPSTIEESSWSSSYPSSVSEGTWIHSRTKVDYSDGHTTVTYHSSRIGENGQAGSAGYNTAPVFLYKRSATAISSVGFSNTLTYTFATGELNSTPNGWSQSIPADDGNPIYVTVATAYSNTATDTIASSEWATPVLFVQNGGHGINTAPVFLYKRAASAPDKPTSALTYTFATGVLSGTLSGWSQTIPDTGGNPCWVIQATAVGTGATDSIAASEWSEQHKLVEDGAAGKDAVIYSLDPFPNNVNFRSNANGEFLGTQTVTCKIKKTVGNTTTEISSGTDGLYLYFWRVGELTSSAAYPNGGVSVSASGAIDENYPVTGVRFTLSTSSSAGGINANNTVKEVTVPVLCDGRKGQKGDDGTDGRDGTNGTNGADGKDAERYWIEVADGTREVRFTSDFAGITTGTPSTLTLVLKHLKGSTEETLGTVPSGYSMQYLNDGGTWETITPGSRNMESDMSDGAYSPAVYRLRKGSTELCRISIRAVREYQRMLLPAGKYISKEYLRTPTTTPLVLLESSGEYWFLVADTNRVGNTYVAPNDANQYVWQKANDYDVVLTKMLFALFAKLGGFIVYGNFFFSQYGTLVAPGGETEIREGNVGTVFTGNSSPPYTLNGNSVNNGYIICKVSFYAQAGTVIGIRIIASSESSYDCGCVGALDSDTLGSLTSASSILAQSFFMEASGTKVVSSQVTVLTTGIHYFYIAYAKDGSGSYNDDNVTFDFSSAEFNIELVRRSSSALTYTSSSRSTVPYGWFAPGDPMAERTPAAGYKFRPAKCIDAMTGEEWMAGGRVHVDKDGNMEMRDISVNDAIIEGSLMCHKVYVDKAGNYIRPFTFWNANGVGIDIDGSATVKKITLHYDTIIISGSQRSSAYNLFTGIVCTGYTVILPPARFFVGMRIKIINGTISGSNGTAASRNPSPINLGVIYRADTEEYKDLVDQSYTANMIVAAIPMTFNKGGNSFTFIGSPDSAKCEDLTPSTAENFTVFGLKGDSTTVYRFMELVAQKNPYISTYNTTQNGQDASDYAWMIIDAQQ